jgi:diadenosine tetraphosphate (Ap4A) HIT family hydrolase
VLHSSLDVLIDRNETPVMAQHKACLFCELGGERILHQSALAVVFADSFPVSVGHCLVVPRRHVASLFGTTEDEQREMLRLLSEARASIQKAHAPAGFNIGINDGPAAGQSIPHLHIHLIPRYTGDVAEPRGGVRWVLPARANYWSARK